LSLAGDPGQIPGLGPPRAPKPARGEPEQKRAGAGRRGRASGGSARRWARERAWRAAIACDSATGTTPPAAIGAVVAKHAMLFIGACVLSRPGVVGRLPDPASAEATCGTRPVLGRMPHARRLFATRRRRAQRRQKGLPPRTTPPRARSRCP
jgi:hypothetical protein